MGPVSFVFIKTSAALGIVVATAAASPARGGDGALIADSLADFSSSQGLGNWRYGHYTADGDPLSFAELCCHDPAGDHGGWWEHSPEQPPWNLVWAEGQHPDATWTVRRWVCEATALIQLDITSDHWPGEPGATTVRVLNNGALLYERVLPQGGGGRLTESVFALVTRDDPLDFTVGADGDPAGDSTLLRAQIFRIAVLPPAVDGPSVVEVAADAGTCEAGYIPVEPDVTASCQDGAIVITGGRGDGLALDDPYPLGITRIDWTVDELDCPNDPVTFPQWILVRADGCPDCNGNGQPDDCVVYNATQDILYLTIQGALDAALDGDEIVVGPGTYRETIDFLGKPVTLRSSGGPDVTAIDIQGMDDSVVTCSSGEGPGTILDGFTITGSGHAGNGGGMSIAGSSPVVTNCRFAGNTVGGDGAGMAVAGNGHPTVTGCVFAGNTAVGHGGGLHAGFSSVSVSNCVFSGNAALRGAGLHAGQGLECHVSGCVFSGNAAVEGGGTWIAVFDDAGAVTVTNCTFSDNTAQLGSGMWMASACAVPVAVTNCILWNQVLVDLCGESHLYEYNDGDIVFGANNINADPLFADPDGGDGVPGTEDDDLRLLPGSPCVDAGTNEPPVANDLSCRGDLDGNERFADDPDTPDTGFGDPPIVDMGAYELGSPPMADCNGNRTSDACEVDDDPGLDADGTGILDECEDRGDLDGDGTVGIEDFLILLAEWGPCPGEPDPCPADLDDDGAVGIIDFLMLIANWTV